MSSLFGRILVAIDDSEPAKTALALGARLAREHDGELVLCHALNWLPIIAEIESTGVIFDPQPTIEGLTRNAQAMLDGASQDALRFGVAAKHHLIEGEPAKAILALANKLRCGTIVMGTHARGGLGRLFIGSTTEAVLRGSSIPVLTVRPGTVLALEPRKCFERNLAAAERAAGLRTMKRARRYLLCHWLDPKQGKSSIERTALGFAHGKVGKRRRKSVSGPAVTPINSRYEAFPHEHELTWRPLVRA